jgi:hypothetical protein
MKEVFAQIGKKWVKGLVKAVKENVAFFRTRVLRTERLRKNGQKPTLWRAENRLQTCNPTRKRLVLPGDAKNAWCGTLRTTSNAKSANF